MHFPVLSTVWVIMAFRQSMQSIKSLSAGSLFALVAVVTFAFSPQQRDAQAVFTTDTRLVVLHATVVDKTGHLITTLPQNAFQVYENGVQQQVKLFKREDIPVSMGLIIDNSGSMRDKRQKVEAAALGLVKASNPDQLRISARAIPRRGYRFAASEDEVTAPLPAARRTRIPAIVAGVSTLILAAFIYWQFYQPSRFVTAQGQRALLAGRGRRAMAVLRPRLGKIFNLLSNSGHKGKRSGSGGILCSASEEHYRRRRGAFFRMAFVAGTTPYARQKASTTCSAKSCGNGFPVTAVT
jgi:hypothetical protein